MTFPRFALAAAVLIVLSGCAGPAVPSGESSSAPVAEVPAATPAPSASATPSTTAEPGQEVEPLVVSTAGLGDVKLDAPVPTGLDYATWDPEYCGDSGAFAEVGTTRENTHDFTIFTTKFNSPEKDVVEIFVIGEAVVTPSGVHVGQTLDEVKATLPDMKRVRLANPISTVFVVEDTLGQLVFEFDSDDVLKLITALSNSREPAGLWYSSASSICPV